ncbi:MAG: phosphodiester glycosidase family protein [Verrucomicrobiota bacterium]|nr:phosphodiester glycosidase family protein [Verrucomicrobiota bacterium]
MATCMILAGCTSQPGKPGAPPRVRPLLPGISQTHPPSGASPDGSPARDKRTELPLPLQRDAPSFFETRASRVPLQAGIKRVTSRGISLILFLFDDRNYSISVADKEQGPQTEWPTAKAAAKAHKALAAINAGFFTPEGRPLGLVIENGRQIGTWNAQSSLASGLLSVEKSPRLLRRQHWRSFSPTSHLVQAGPLLVENSLAVNGLDDGEHCPRSFLTWDGGSRWAFGYCEKATLSELALSLAAQPLKQLDITTALNLDGGRSSDLWVSPEVPGGPLTTRKLWNRPVRNYLLLHRRSR